MATVSLSHLEEGVCLLCGTTVPVVVAGGGRPAEDRLQALGWHCWHSRVPLAANECLDSSLRLCPRCLTDPMLVAKTILADHGFAHMVEWLTSMESLDEVQVRH